MATLHWNGDTDTDLNKPANYVDDGAGGSNQIAAFTGSDPANDDIILQSSGAANVSNQPTVNANVTFNSVQIDSGCTLTGNDSYTVTIDGKLGDYAFNHDGTISGDLNLNITTSGTSRIDPNASGNINDLTYNSSGGTLEIHSTMVLDGDLTITAGTIDTLSGDPQDLTVTGDCDITGTLTANASVMDLFSMRINHGGTYNATSGTTTLSDSDTSAWGKVLYVHTDGTFNHNNGTMKFDGGSIPEITVVDQSLTKNPYYNLWCSGDVCAVYNSTFVLNNATVRGIRFNGGVSTYFHVEGICENTAGDFSDVAAGKQSESANNYFGTFHLSGGKLLLTQMEITVGSFRNTGGTVE